MTSHIAPSLTFTRMVLAAFVAIAISIPVAFAQVPMKDPEIRSVTVKYADLNLSTEEGTHALYGRLVMAARKVCPAGAAPLIALSQNREAERCVADTVQRAVKDIKNQKLADVAASRMR